MIYLKNVYIPVTRIYSGTIPINNYMYHIYKIHSISGGIIMTNIGIDVKTPENVCDDINCPFHGKLPVRGQTFEGVVTSDKGHNTVVIEREIIRYLSKYERYEKRTVSMIAHNSPCISAKVGDIVKIMECRPISKTKSFVVIEKTIQE
jgi:small subunit ribosomal protein S17